MKKKPATAAEKRHMSRVAAIGCIACLNKGYGQTRPEDTGIHHIRTGYGASQRAPHTEVIGLCALHHQYGGLGVAFHAGQESWEANFGNELELLEQVRMMLDG